MVHAGLQHADKFSPGQIRFDQFESVKAERPLVFATYDHGSIRAAKAVLDHIEAYLPPTKGKVVLHWFTGSKADATRALELGCYFSINAAMLDNERACINGRSHSP